MNQYSIFNICNELICLYIPVWWQNMRNFYYRIRQPLHWNKSTAQKTCSKRNYINNSIQGIFIMYNVCKHKSNCHCTQSKYKWIKYIKQRIIHYIFLYSTHNKPATVYTAHKTIANNTFPVNSKLLCLWIFMLEIMVLLLIFSSLKLVRIMHIAKIAPARSP